jgi:hypothetical protein
LEAPCDITTEKTQSNCKNVESNVLTDFFNLQRRARIQNLSNLTKMLPLRSLTMHGAVSKEITEIIWICNVMGFFFKFGKKIEENITFNI